VALAPEHVTGFWATAVAGKSKEIAAMQNKAAREPARRAVSFVKERTRFDMIVEQSYSSSVPVKYETLHRTASRCEKKDK
jgi:hypothetical protein